MKYFISQDSKVSGPFSKQQIRAAIKSKKLSKTDLLGTSANGPWQTVEDAMGTKKPKASTATKPVESEAQNKQGNASAGETDDFGDLPAVRKRKLIKRRKALKKREAREEREERKVKESAEQSRNFKKKIAKNIAAGLLVVFIIVVAFGVYRISMPYKLKWAASSALDRFILYSAKHESMWRSRLERGDLHGTEAEERTEEKMEEAAIELDLIKSQMSEELREEWELEQVDKLLER
jgi:hypothetical protein